MEITKIFDSFEEFRSKTNQKYPVQEIAFLVVASLMCGMNSWHAMCRFGNTNLDWLRNYFPYTNDIPTRHNIARIIRAIKPESLSELLVVWAKNYHAFEAVQSDKKSIATKNKDDKKRADETTKFQKIIAIDGKDVRGVQARTDSALNVVSVFDVGNGITIGTEMGLGKGQEIEMVRQVLSKLNLKECIVTLDALHCQKETVEEIVKQKEAALIQVKKNQAKLYETIDAQFQELWSKPEASQGAVTDKENKSHGRLEQRAAYVLPIKLDEKLLKKWPRIKTAIAIVRDRTVKGKTGSYTTSYYICTSAISASEALDIVRKHWGVENKLHWILDVTFKEDSSEVHD